MLKSMLDSEILWMNWLQRRLTEVIVFLFISLAMWASFDRFAELGSVLIVVGAILAVYVGIFFYLPLSAVVWFAFSARRNVKWRRIADSIFFAVHSYDSISIMHNGLLGIEREIDLLSTSTTPWFAVIVFHAGSLAFTIMRMR